MLRIKTKLIELMYTYYGIVNVARSPDATFWRKRAKSVASLLTGTDSSDAQVAALSEVGGCPKYDTVSVRRTYFLLSRLRDGDLSFANSYELTRCVTLCYGYYTCIQRGPNHAKF